MSDLLITVTALAKVASTSGRDETRRKTLYKVGTRVRNEENIDVNLSMRGVVDMMSESSQSLSQGKTTLVNIFEMDLIVNISH